MPAIPEGVRLWQLTERAASTWLAQDGKLPTFEEEGDVISWVMRTVQLEASDQGDLDRYAEYFQEIASIYCLSEHDKTALHNAHMLFITGVLLDHGKIAVAVIDTPAN